MGKACGNSLSPGSGIASISSGCQHRQVKSTTTPLPAMLWPICGREKIRRDACNESAAELALEACTYEDRQVRVQCSFCRELEHEEPSFCRKLAHEEPMGEKSVDFSAMACRKISFLPFF